MLKRSPLRRSDPSARASVPVFKKKTCPECKGKYTPHRPIQPVCNDMRCNVSYAEKLLAKKKAAAALADRRETKEKLEKLKTRSQWLKEAQVAFNAWARARDAAANLPCISCGRHHQGSYDAGHYLTVGARPELRFSEINVWRQCVPCNQHLHGNLVLYRQELVRRIGLAQVEWLEGHHEPKHYSIEDLKAIKAKYRALTKALTAA